MKILHIVPYFPPDHWGGIEIHVLELCKYAQNHNTTVVAGTYDSSNAASNGEMSGKTRVYRLRSYEVPEIGFLFPRTYNPYVPFLENKLQELGDFDLVHAHGQEYFMSHAAVRFAAKRGIPAVLTIHNSGEAFAGSWGVRLARSVLEKNFFKETIRTASFAIAISPGGLTYLSRFDPQATSYIPNGIDMERFESCEKAADYVLFVGRLEPLKAPDTFVRAIPLVLRESRTKFLIVGTGSMKDYLRKLAEKLGVSMLVDFQENLSYDELARTVSRASMVVAPANAVYTLLEAGAACKPSITVRSSWNEGALGDAALFVEPNDVRGIADGIVKILRDGGFATRLGRRAYDFVRRNRDWRVIYPKVDKVYRNLAG